MNAVYILLYNKDKKILIQHRTSDAPTAPNHWGFFGGAIEENETPLQAIKREAIEELNIKLKNPKLVLKENVKSKDKKNYYFVEEFKNKSKIRLGEGQGMKWIFPNEIDNLLAKPYVKKAIKIISKKLK